MAELPLSPLAPDSFPALSDIAGIRLSVGQSGMKYKGRDDVMLLLAQEGSTVAGIFTQSATAAAPVDWSRAGIASGNPRAIITNAGNANAFTGTRGVAAMTHYLSRLAEGLSLADTQILVASTGVIGEPISGEAMAAICETLVADGGHASWQDAAGAIRTTDTFAKGATTSCIIGGSVITINGIAKGSGMIAPDMATMLAYIATDAAISGDCLDVLLRRCAEKSFNAITVDSDTSTSDSVYLIATGAVDMLVIANPDSPEAQQVQAALQMVMTDLAHQIVKDGEGAQKFITVTVTGAQTDADAKIIALAIANSPLVKTAIAGEDANWGRIVMAVGKSGAAASRDELSIAIGGTIIAEQGERVEGYDEAPVRAHMEGHNIDITVDVGMRGTGQSTIWTCDLTHGYISINADYRS
jgi:glutamate N-acetyltransferase/amino-acid N-acetyltransferase